MATGTTEFVDSTTALVFVPEVWSLISIVAREAALVFANTVDRRYEEGLRFGDTVHVPSIGNLAARSKARSTNAAITFETVTETNTNITVQTWEYTAMAVESIIEVQSNRDMIKAYAGKMGYGVALSMDSAIATNVASFTNTVGTTAVENMDEEWLRARQYLNDANAPTEGRYIVISPAAETGLLKLDRYVHNDYSQIHGMDARTTSMENAYLTSFYRIPVYVSTNVSGSNAAGHDNSMHHKESMALVMSERPTLRHMYDINYFVDKVALENVYGTRIMRNDHGVRVRGA